MALVVDGFDFVLIWAGHLNYLPVAMGTLGQDVTDLMKLLLVRG